MSKKTSRMLASVMLVIAVCFVGYALSHPEASFSWSNAITFGMIGAYLAVMIILFAAPFQRQ